MEQARRAVRHALGMKAPALSPLLPNGIYTIPEISMVGETEESLKKQAWTTLSGARAMRKTREGGSSETRTVF